MSGKRIEELANVETEHLLGLGTGLPLVKLRCESDGTVLVGQLTCEQARDIAARLAEAAARAEYEHDLYGEMKRADWTDPMIGGVMLMVRNGEQNRHVGPFS